MAGIHVEIRGQLIGVISLFLLYVFWGPNSGSQTSQLQPLSTQPFYESGLFFEAMSSIHQAGLKLAMWPRMILIL